MIDRLIDWRDFKAVDCTGSDNQTQNNQRKKQIKT